MKSTRLPGNPSCPVCHTLLDEATSVKGDVLPEAGHVTVCSYCFAVCRFELLAMAKDINLILVEVTPEEFIDLPAELRSQIHLIAKAMRGGPRLINPTKINAGLTYPGAK